MAASRPYYLSNIQLLLKVRMLTVKLILLATMETVMKKLGTSWTKSVRHMIKTKMLETQKMGPTGCSRTERRHPVSDSEPVLLMFIKGSYSVVEKSLKMYMNNVSEIAGLHV